MMDWFKRTWRKWFGASDPDGIEAGPMVTMFLEGSSLRKSVYFCRESDPALAAAGPWLEQIRAGEKAIRAHVDALRERIEDLEAELAEAQEVEG